MKPTSLSYRYKCRPYIVGIAMWQCRRSIAFPLDDTSCGAVQRPLAPMLHHPERNKLQRDQVQVLHDDSDYPVGP